MDVVRRFIALEDYCQRKKGEIIESNGGTHYINVYVRGLYTGELNAMANPEYFREVFEIAAAPKNRPIIGIYPDGSEDLIEWVEDAKCMMAGIAGGYGYFGEGWQSVDVNLIVDTPKYWREA